MLPRSWIIKPSILEKKRVCALFFSLFLAGVLGSNTFSFSEARTQGVVRSVVDGDTFRLETGERVRLLGINAPEYEPWKNNVEYYGKEAAEYARKILGGKRVVLERDTEEKDKYGRTLAYVYLESGEFVNLLLVQEGFARARYYAPNGRYRKMLGEAQQKARLSKKGMWASNV